jgi:hypothetical protein
MQMLHCSVVFVVFTVVSFVFVSETIFDTYVPHSRFCTYVHRILFSLTFMPIIYLDRRTLGVSVGADSLSESRQTWPKRE